MHQNASTSSFHIFPGAWNLFKNGCNMWTSRDMPRCQLYSIYSIIYLQVALFFGMFWHSIPHTGIAASHKDLYRTRTMPKPIYSLSEGVWKEWFMIMYINPKQPKCLTNFLLLWKARCQYAQWRAIQFCQSSYASPFSANTESPWKATIQWNWVGLCGFGRCNIFMIIHAYLAYWVLYIIVYPHIDSVISVESFLKTCAPWQVLEYFREVSGSMCAFYLQLGYTDNLFPSIYIVVSLYQDMYIYPHTHVDIVDLIKDQLVGLLLLDGADRVFVPLKKEDDSEPLAAYAFLALCWVMWRP